MYHINSMSLLKAHLGEKKARTEEIIETQARFKQGWENQRQSTHHAVLCR